MISRYDLHGLRQLIDTARITANASIPPQLANRTVKLLETAIKMADDLIARPTVAEQSRRKFLKARTPERTIDHPLTGDAAFRAGQQAYREATSGKPILPKPGK
jgi:hypothetical protein